MFILEEPYEEKRECEFDPVKDGIISREPLREPWERGTHPRTVEYVRGKDDNE